jgi:hypothetical protein
MAMSNPTLWMKCSNCGMPLAEGDLFIYLGRDWCENCLPIRTEMVCDFCNEPDPEWVYDSAMEILMAVMELDTHDITIRDLGDAWAACTACRVLIDDADVTALVGRVMLLRGLPPEIRTQEQLFDFVATIRTYFSTVFDLLIKPPKEFPKRKEVNEE